MLQIIHNDEFLLLSFSFSFSFRIKIEIWPKGFGCYISKKDKNKNNRIVFIIYVACTIFLTNNIVQQYIYPFISFSQFFNFWELYEKSKNKFEVGGLQ